MKPIPAPSSHEDSPDAVASSASDLLKSTSPRPSGNRRSPQASVNQAYPWLLVASTAVAVFFGFMYINKDVVVAPTAADQADATNTGEGDSSTQGDRSLLPEGDSLPGEHTASGTGGTAGTGDSTQNLTTAPIHSSYEETNMRMQHILTATANDGSISRIDLEVPVLYRSRQLRWSPAEVARAEDLMIQLMEYQDRSRQLRAQGEKLLTDWNALIGQSIPASRLRADSPSIPANQKDGQAASGPVDTTTSDAIELKDKEDKP